MVSIAERRKRIDLHLDATLQAEDEAGHAFSEETRTRNISASGLSFESRHHLPIGGRVHLEIRIPEPLRKHFGGQALYRAEAIVCRVERFEDAQLSRVGARFVAGGDGSKGA